MVAVLDNNGSKRSKLLEYFLKFPTTPIHLRGLERKIGISATWISQAAKEHQKRGLLTVIRAKDRKEVDILAARDNPRFIWLKRACNLDSLHELTAYLDRSYGRPACIIVFGSYAKGTDTETSDIDIAVISQKHHTLQLGKFEKGLSRKISIKEIPPEKLTPEFLNTLANGIVLKGYLSVNS